MARSSSESTPDGPPVNEAHIRGRVSGDPTCRELPSGDTITCMRVVVPRPPPARRGTRVSVDTIECVAWTRRGRSSMERLVDQDQVAVSGALRRRFWRAGGKPTSMVEIEVSRIRRIPVASDRRRRGRQRSEPSGQ